MVGKADPAERLEATILLRRSNAADLKDRVSKLSRQEGPRQHLSREDFEKRFGAGDCLNFCVRGG